MITESKHPACIACIAARKTRFGDDWNKLKCTGIKTDEEWYDEARKVTSIPDEIEAVRKVIDPYEWGIENFALNRREYQDTMTKCTSTMKVFRTGRRVGKCLSGDTYIHHPDGSRTQLLNLVNTNFNVLSYDHKTGQTFSQKAIAFKNLTKPSYKISFKSGREIIASYDHPFMAFNQWINAEDLSIGDRIATEYKGIFGSNTILDSELEFLAYIIGDGGCSGSNINFTNTNPIIIERMKEISNRLECYMVSHKDDNITYSISSIASASGKHQGPSSNKAIALLKRYGVMYKLAKHKSIHSDIFNLNQISMGLFLNRLFSTDGWASVSKSGIPEIGYCSASKTLIKDIQEMLFKFGIRASLSHKKDIKLNDKHFEAWQLSIKDKSSIQIFHNKIGILGKETQLEKVFNISQSKGNADGKSYTDTLPNEIWELVQNRIGEKSTQSAIGNIRIRGDNPSRNKIKTIATLLKDIRLDSVANANIVWDIINNIEYVGAIQTYDVSVENNNYELKNFSANGIFVHNTEVMLLSALHRMMLNKNLKILLFTPYETQIRVFFNRIDEWMEKSSVLRSSKKRLVKSPFTFELYNGSSLTGFTTGTKSGMKSASARGQEADIIILDEADYLTRDDLTAILPMLQKTDENSLEDKELWCASTPTGRHDFFYEWANSSAFKEFHHASWINPAWNAEEEARSHDLFPNETDWDHEYAAEWGEEKEGVYSQSYIERAIILSRTLLGNDGKWDYKKQLPKGGCVYTIGVDWNSSANGVQIVVVEMDPTLVTPEDIAKGITARFRVVTRADIDSKEFTQHKAVGKIIEYNRIWNPKAIYVDEGYGMTQIEDLKRYGHKHPETKIIARLKGINFSSMHEVRDPVTKTIIKKPMKPFMVNTAVRFFEDNVILLNKSDLEFEKQLRDYTVAKRSREGRPVYSEGNDHILDAFNLAILAFFMEYSDLGKPIYTNRMAMVGPMGEKRTEQRVDENGDLKIVDRSKEYKQAIVKPRQIPLTDMEGNRLNRSFNMGQYSSARHNRPIKRSI